MFTKRSAGEFAENGIYWRRSNWEFISVPEEGGILMGEPGEWYMRAPTPVVLILGPLMGLLFFFALPLSGMLVLAPMVAGRVRSAVTAGSLNPANLTNSAQPGVSYLEPRLRNGAAEPKAEIKDGDTGKLLDLTDRISDKNNQGK